MDKNGSHRPLSFMNTDANILKRTIEIKYRHAQKIITYQVEVELTLDLGRLLEHLKINIL